MNLPLSHPDSNIKIDVIPAFKDNYIWAIYHKNDTKVVIVDPGDAKVVIQFLEEAGVGLSDILLSHHHPDHVEGVPELLKQFPKCRVFGPSNEEISCVNNPVQGGESFRISQLVVSVLDIPGHTKDHKGYLIGDNLFCGDTLFSAGCGRVFDGSVTDLFRSLCKLRALPDQTQVYCAHEYTLANLQFAMHVEPANPKIKEYYEMVANLLKNGGSSIPTSIQQEKLINPFFKFESEDVKTFVKNSAGLTNLTAELVFSHLRELKDTF
jgi:hydroxyacylglutathione hydrolase